MIVAERGREGRPRALAAALLAAPLKLVQLTSAGHDRADVEAARKAGVPVR